VAAPFAGTSCAEAMFACSWAAKSHASSSTEPFDSCRDSVAAVANGAFAGVAEATAADDGGGGLVDEV
jgi:hypothetical protein